MSVRRLDFSALAAPIADGATVLVPNQRIRAAVLATHAASCDAAAWRTPPVFAIDIWIKRLWERLAFQGIAPFSQQTILESGQETLAWLDIVERSTATDLPLLNVDQAAREAQRAYQLLRMWLEPERGPDSLPGFGATAEHRLFRDWCAGFGALCEGAGLLSLVDATQTLIARIEEIRDELPARLLLVNFYQPPPRYRRLFEALEKVCACSVVLTRKAQPAGGRVHPFSDPRQELQACADWVSGIIGTDPLAHVGVLFDGDDMLRREVERTLADRLTPVAVVTPLDAQPVFNGRQSNRLLTGYALIQDAFTILALGEKHLDNESFCRLLQSPHIAGYEEELAPRLRLETHLRNRHAGRLTLNQVARMMSDQDQPYFCPRLTAALLAYRNHLRAIGKTASASRWSRQFGVLLSLLGWPGTARATEPLERQILSAWQALLRDFAATGPVQNDMAAGKALTRLRSLCQQRSLPARFHDECQLSLYTLDEAVGLEFDHLWYLNCNDEIQPSAASPSPFLPYRQQHDAGIPDCHAELQLSQARQSLEIVCASTARPIRASFHASNGDAQFRPSSLLRDLEPELLEAPEVKPLNSVAWHSRGGLPLEYIDDGEPVPLREISSDLTPGDEDGVTGGHQILSNQSACPFRAFARHRLLATPLEEFGAALDNRLRGSAMHRALEHLFRDIPDSDSLRALQPDRLNSIAGDAAEVAVGYLAGRRADVMTPRFRQLEKDRVAALLVRLLEMERQRGDFAVVARESPVSWDVEALTVNLFIDRVDRLPDGSLVVIDYKTGRQPPRVNQLLNERPEDLQLQVYYCASGTGKGETVSGVVITQVNVEKIGYSGLVRDPGFHPDLLPTEKLRGVKTEWNALVQPWQQKLADLALEFTGGSARVAPANGRHTCTWCGLQPLCRIGELERSLNVANDDEDAFDESA